MWMRCRRRAAWALRAGLALAMAAPALVAGQQPPPAPAASTAEQRAEAWRALTPQQREARRAEARERMQQMTPEQRAARREQIEQWRREPGMQGGGPRRLSPEERQQLRRQIEEANRSHEGPRRGR